MTFTTPTVRVASACRGAGRAFDYAELCRLLWDQCDARFERALVKGRVEAGVRTDRGVVKAPLVVDALGWRRVLGAQPFAGTGGPLSRGLEVHPTGGGRRARRRHRSLARPPRLLLARSRRRRGARRCGRVRPTRRRQATDGRHRTSVSACRRCATRATSSRIGSGRPRRTAASSSETPPAIASRSRRRGSAARSTSGSRAAASCAACWRATRPWARRSRPTAPSARVTAAGSGSRTSLQRVIPELPPRALTVVIRSLSRQRLGDAIFNWYLGLLPVPPYSSGSNSPGPKVRTSAPLSSARTT